MDILVLGGGIVGRAITFILKNKGNVTVADFNKETLRNMEKEFNVSTLKVDASKDDLSKIMNQFDFISSALPGKFGMKVLKAASKAGINIVDTSFMPEDYYILQKQIEKSEIIAVPDCGVAPGLSNIIIGYASTFFETVENVEIKVGGLPEKNIEPLGYKVVFSSADTLDEYMRRVTIIRYGKVIQVEPGEGVEYFHVETIGELEAFYTDGLRSLIKNIKAKNMGEKTVRYKGHIEKIKFLKQLGLLDDLELEVNNKKIVPKEVLAILFSKHLQFPEVKDLLYMKIKVSDSKSALKFQLYDKHDDSTNLSAMARTTGFTNAVVSQLVMEDKIERKGLIAPEILGFDKELYNEIIERLKHYNVNVMQK